MLLLTLELNSDSTSAGLWLEQESFLVLKPVFELSAKSFCIVALLRSVSFFSAPSCEDAALVEAQPCPLWVADKYYSVNPLI